MRDAPRATLQSMISSFRHKGSQALYEAGVAHGVSPDQVKKLRRILAALDSIASPRDLDGIPGLRPHRLKGKYRGFWSVVTGNWRVIFRFIDDEVVDVDLVDYH